MLCFTGTMQTDLASGGGGGGGVVFINFSVTAGTIYSGFYLLLFTK